MPDLLSIGASGVRAYQTALTTVSENIANAGNISYARRAVALEEIVAGGGLHSGYGANGMGVSIGATSRGVDLYRAAAVRSAGTDLARTEVGSVWLERIQDSLTGNDLAGRLTAFFNSARTVAADPESTAPRAVMLESAASVAAGFAATGAALTQAAADLDANGAQGAANLSSLATALARVNDALGRVTPGTAASAGLEDQRDAILEDMSILVDVDATFDAAGRATVRAGGAAGPVLVTGNDAGTVSYARNADGAVSFLVSRAGTTSTLAPNGGVFAGVADGAQRLQDSRRALDTLARDFVSGVNDVQAQGRDLNGVAGAAMFAVGDDPTDIAMVLDDPAGIAAAAVGEGTRGSGNLASLDALRTSAGYESRLTALVATNAAAIEGRSRIAAAQGAIRDGAITARDAVSGVDLDSEAVDLLRFQQAYQASSRVIQVARETLQSILEIR